MGLDSCGLGGGRLPMVARFQVGELPPGEEAMTGPMELWTLIRSEYLAVGMTDWQFALCAVAGLSWGWWDGRRTKAKKREANRRWWARWHLGVKTAFLVKQDREARAEEARLL